MVYIQKNSPLKQLDDNAQKRAMKKEDKAWKRSKRQEHVIAKQEHKEANPKNQKKKAIQDIRTNYKIQKLQGKLNSPLTQRIKGPWPDDTGDKLMKGIGKVGDFGKKWGKEFIKANVGIIKGHYDVAKHMITTGTLPTVENMRKSTGPKGPVDTPSSRLPQGKLPAGTTQQSAQKMGLMIKKLRKIPISTTPELPKGTEKSTMGLFNPQPPKKSTSELKVLTGTDLSKHKRKLI